jgi:hypothetical protein
MTGLLFVLLIPHATFFFNILIMKKRLELEQLVTAMRARQ